MILPTVHSLIITQHLPTNYNTFRNKMASTVLASLIFEALSMLVTVVIIILEFSSEYVLLEFSDGGKFSLPGWISAPIYGIYLGKF